MAKKNLSGQKYNIVCLSNQLWDFPNWTNKRHVMSRLAKTGNKVVFVDPPINFGKVFLKQIRRGLWPMKRLFTQCNHDNKSGAYIFTPINLIPMSSITSLIHVIRIKGLVDKYFSKKRKTLLWVYHVQISNLENYLKYLKYDILIYDCVDNYEGFPIGNSIFSTNVSKQALLQQEKKLAEQADVIFASAPGLAEKLNKYNSAVYYTPNVGDFHRFKNTRNLRTKVPKELSDIPRPRVGMIGSLDSYKFDSQLVKKCALENPDVSFVLIGPIALKDRDASLDDISLGGVNNIYYLGSKPYEEKKYYMAGFDAEMIPYQLNDYTVGGCFPVKFHDSLAAGLPVLVTNLPAYAPFSEVCYIAKNPEEFSANIKRAIEEDTPKRILERQRVAKLNDWDTKVGSMLQIIDDFDK